MKWADDRLLAAVPASAGYAAVTAKLDHIYRAEAVWLRRVLGEPGAKLADIESVTDPEALRRFWPAVHREWLEWAPLAGDSGWDRIVPHMDSAGNSYRLPAWQIVMHVVNHGSYHRGQIATMMRETGIQPPATDLVMFYREQ